MYKKVKIIKTLPKARTGYQVNGSLANDISAFGGGNYTQGTGVPQPEVSKTLTSVPREMANLEAEGGETVVGNLDGSKMPSFKTIKGPRHSSGGVPLLLPEDSFIFSDTAAMKITDPKFLGMFGVSPKKGGYTPAELSKKYSINDYRKILQDSNSDMLSRKTAEIMIKNYVMKLGSLALAQESKKGFPQGIPLIARPYMEAMGLAEEDIMPMPQQQEAMMQEAPEMQEEMQGQEMADQNEMPEQMPSGAPIAQPQPMAMYGMSMGGYDMPFYSNEMQYGGNLPKAQNGAMTKAQLQERLKKDPSKVRKEKLKQSQIPAGYDQIEGNVYGKGTFNESKSVSSSLGVGKSGTGAPNAAWDKMICNELSKGVSIEELVAKKHGSAAGLTKRFADCIKKGEEVTKSSGEEYDLLEIEETPEEECPCKDKSGNVIPGKFAKKDKDGKCLPCVKECECTKADGSKYMVAENDDGTCKDCDPEDTTTETETEIENTPVRDPEWWLQDTVNAGGAFADLMGTRKRQPWEGRVDLEEPRPTFIDPTRQLAANAEQANISSQATAQFAGPQAMGARLAAIQGQAAGQAANTLSQVNNQNVNIANQFEANQVGVRNQEQMMNQQIAGRVFDKNTIAQQQFDNAKKAGRSNVRQAYNTAVTNRMKADALNQLNPNFQTGAGSGGKLFFNPTTKSVTATKPEQTMEEYIKSNAGMDKEVLKEAIRIKYGKKFGGSFEMGGSYIYGDTTYPFNFY